MSGVMADQGGTIERFQQTMPSLYLLQWMDVLNHNSVKRKRRLVELRGKHFTVKESEISLPKQDLTLNEGNVERGKDLEVVLTVKTKKLIMYPPDKEVQERWIEGLTFAFAKIEMYYKLGDEIGRGSYSKVYIGRHIISKQQCAVKIVKSRKQDWHLKARETNILLTCVHPNIIRTYDIFESKDRVWFVMEYMEGGLYDIIAESRVFDEENARDVIKDVLEGVAFLHSRNIAHRDLKPENLLCTRKVFPLGVKVSDFGLSNFLVQRKNNETQFLRTVCGSLNYMAPEMTREDGYSTEVDLWSCGVILHVMLTGELPFTYQADTYKFLSSLQAGVHFDENIWATKSAEGKNLVAGLLEVDPKKRLTAKEALRHPWFKETTRLSKHSLRDLSKIRMLKSYREDESAVATSNRGVKLPKKNPPKTAV